MDKHTFSTFLAIMGVSGILILCLITGYIYWFYRGCTFGNFRWHMRNICIKHVTAITCLFCLAMTASYILLAESWFFLYLLIALKAGSVWFRLSGQQRT